MKIRGYFIAASLCALSISSLSAQADADFAKANRDFAQGHFKEAISGYEALIRDGQWTANVFYDLGNAYFRAGDFGRAILNYERALALAQHHPEATANLQIARDEAHALELQASWPERYLQFEIGRAHLNSSHRTISYAVFCLKKKKKTQTRICLKTKKEYVTTLRKVYNTVR